MTPLRCLIAAVALSITAHSQVTGNIITRVFQVRFAGQQGTLSVLDFEDRQYLVTARHMMEAVESGSATVEIIGPGVKDWRAYPVTVLLGKDKCVDVAVLVPKEGKIVAAETIPYPYVFAFGQEAYFLGFPDGLYTKFGNKGGVALIKHAYVSAKVSCAAIYADGNTEDEFLLLDGFNNRGFSGGPIIAPDLFSPQTNGVRVQKLIGVVAGFRNESGKIVVDNHEEPRALAVVNSGIMYATPIEKAVELIRAYASNQK